MSSTPEQEIKRLTAVRGQIKSELTRFETFLSKNPTSLSLIRTRLETICPRILEDFKHVQIEWESQFITGEIAYDEAKWAIERDTFETQYHHCVSKAQDLIDQLCPNQPVLPTPQQNPPIQVSSSFSSEANVNLSRLDLFKFSRSFGEWRGFKDTFDALVHNQQNKSSTEKFHSISYLASCLEGEAADVIAALQINENNYETALELLKNRYENKKVISNYHIREILNLPNVVKENSKNLRHFLDTFLKNYRSLELLDDAVKHRNLILIFILTEK